MQTEYFVTNAILFNKFHAQILNCFV